MIQIQPLEPADWPAVRVIYENGIATGNATFETQAPTWEQWDNAHAPNCRFVATLDQVVVGWAALTPVSGRCVYAGVGEVSVYVHESARGQGIGLQLLNTLVASSEKAGYWTLQAGIFPENTGSMRLHEKAGFRIVGYREKIGRMNGIWRNTMLLERRSQTTG